MAGYGCRVNFGKEDGGVLRLCLNDIHPGNFRKDANGQLFAVDFGKTLFLPTAFQDLAFADGCGFAQETGISIRYPKSKHRAAFRLAAGRLHLFNDSRHGKPLVRFIFTRTLRSNWIGLAESLRQSSGSRDLFK